MVRAVLALAALPLVGWSFASGGCRPGATAPAPSAVTSAATTDASAGETVVHLDDDGRTFEVPVGSAVTFRLASHGGTGYVWVPTGPDGGDGGVLSQVGERTSEASSDTPGAPKLDVLRFVARRAGTATVEMGLVRPWGNQAPVKTLRVTVIAR